MVDEKKICLMTKLARFESDRGKEDLRIIRYSRSDYIGLGLLHNFFLTTFGYVLFVGVLLAYQIDYLLENFHKMNIPMLAAKFVIGYLLFMVIYTVITYIKRHFRYKKAKKNVRYYHADLERLYGNYYEDTSGENMTAGGKCS